MAKLRLSVACWDYDRTAALHDGRVTAEGIDLLYLDLPPEETFFRMLHTQEFDVAEMSLSSYVLSLFTEEAPLVAIPVFPSRMFRHSAIYIAAHMPADDPAALINATVGVPEYQITAAVWIRGILAEHYGVSVEQVRYRTGGLHQPGRVEKLPVNLPERFDVQPIAPEQTLDELLRAGKIDALYSARAPRSIAPSAGGQPLVRRLFSDAPALERAYAKQTGIFPIMHTVVIRRELYERHRWIASSLWQAFAAAKQLVYDQLQEMTALKYSVPWLPAAAQEAAALLGDDFWPYGLSANRVTLETFLRYSYEQGLAGRLLTPAELFAAETLEHAVI